MITPFIYGLVDPRDGRVRYVGKSVRSTYTVLGRHIDGSLLSHMEGYNTPKCVWIRELHELDLVPTVQVITETSWERINADEAYWIKEYQARYDDLLNRKPGGGGGYSSRFTVSNQAELDRRRRGIKRCGA